MTIPNERTLILGTAGHIDHGKSTLIQALTGTDPDRLAEEKRRGITIELGFAQLLLPNGTQLGVVDVPGHEKFVRQMIAGATGIDVALLCVAADDGVMPQTLEHLAVLDVLGITRCVVALTKSDLVDDEWLSLIQDEVRSALAPTPFANAPLVPVSAKTGAGLDALLHALQKSVEGVQGHEAKGAVRLPIDRVFTIKGAGTVITGTLWKGTVHLEDELSVLPSHRSSRVRSIQNHGTAVDEIGPGNRTALNLPDLKTSDLAPGDFLITPGTLDVSDRFDARLTYLPTTEAQHPLESGSRVHVAHGTREVLGRVLLMNGQETLLPHESAYAQIRLEEDLPVSHADRFVIRSYSPVQVIGGGVVLNSHPRRRTTLRQGEAEMLDALASGTIGEQCEAVIRAAETPMAASEVARIVGVTAHEACRALEGEPASGQARVVMLPGASEPYFATRSVVQKNVNALENVLLTFHAQYPEATGMTKEALRHRMPHHLDSKCFEALLQSAASEGKVVTSEAQISHPKASAGARNMEEKNAAALLALLEDARSTPPALFELYAQAGINEKAGLHAIQLLEKKGRAVRVTKDLCFSKQALDALWKRSERFLRENGAASAAQLKEAMGTSRKFAIPLLEYFDAEGLTRREGDARVLA